VHSALMLLNSTVEALFRALDQSWAAAAEGDSSVGGSGVLATLRRATSPAPPDNGLGRTASVGAKQYQPLALAPVSPLLRVLGQGAGADTSSPASGAGPLCSPSGDGAALAPFDAAHEAAARLALAAIEEGGAARRWAAAAAAALEAAVRACPAVLAAHPDAAELEALLLAPVLELPPLQPSRAAWPASSAADVTLGRLGVTPSSPSITGGVDARLRLAGEALMRRVAGGLGSPKAGSGTGGPAGRLASFPVATGAAADEEIASPTAAAVRAGAVATVFNSSSMIGGGDVGSAGGGKAGGQDGAAAAATRLAA